VFFLRSLSSLPFFVLYLFADFLFVVAYYIVRYRKDVVRKNLINSFPDKNAVEIREIQRKFYKNLADTSVETIKLLTISEEDLLKRVKFDSSLTRKYHDLGYDVFGMTAHFSNWEWLLVAGSNQVGLKLHAAYQTLRNPFFDKLMIKIRTRFGVVMHEKRDVIKDVINMKGESYLMSMVADQRPFSNRNIYWSTFMNQDAAFYTGTEMLARRMDIKVVYASMKRVKRGYYEVRFLDIESSPLTSEPNAIIQKFIDLAEKNILDDPSSYLWSHDRWKHKRY
jgi:KDO2-lipid IV(A) lauroyltransferase